MKSGSLVAQSLRFHWRANLGVLLGAILSTAILVGALAVGDSVRYSLRSMALARLGGIHYALNGQTRFFRTELADDLIKELNTSVAPVILLRGTATGQPQGGEETRAGRVQVLGVDSRFWPLAETNVAATHPDILPSNIGKGGPPSQPSPQEQGEGAEKRNLPSPVLGGGVGGGGQESVALSDRLAQKLGVKAGDDVVLRVDKPSLLSRDAPLSTVSDASVTLRLPVGRIVTDAEFGRFSLEANQIPPLNAFVPIEILARAIGQIGRVNGLLVGAGTGKAIAVQDATSALWKHWQLTDASLELRELPKVGQIELRTDRVFLDPPVGDAALKATPDGQGVLTYFVNELRVGNRTTPYSTVTAMPNALLASDLRDDETLINRWLADDLQAQVGDKLKLTYWLVGPMRRLELHSSTFRVKGILPMQGKAVDRDLMPPIPGLADKKNCRDWEPGVPIDLNKLRDKDQQYWTAYRGTPKAFLTLNAGQKIWNNRFGNLTAVRYPEGKTSRGSIDTCIRQALSPASLGLFFVPVREQALAASGQALDFGQLFLGFSFFLIVAALLLMALLFALGVEQRGEEVGILLAVGFLPKQVRRLLLLEGGMLALLASVLGAFAGVYYTQAVVRGLSGVWSGAVGNTALQYHAEPKTLAIGALSGFLVALFTIWLVARRQGRIPARVLLTSGAEAEARETALTPGPSPKNRGGERLRSSLLPPVLGGKAGMGGLLPGIPTALIAFLGALAFVIMALKGEREEAAETFFGAGSLLLIAGLAACRALLARMDRGASASTLTLGSLGARNSARRWGRSLSAIGLLACGSFLVIAIGASRHDPRENAQKRSSGTGGFALYGETTLPVYHDLNTAEGRENYTLDAASLEGVTFVPLRLKDGDEASCLNLNRAQVPRLLGVPPDALRQRKAFTFASALDKAGERDPWGQIESQGQDGVIPVVGDTNTVTWSLGKKLGDIVDYTDDRGRKIKLRIVGVLANAILQGSLLMSESNFTALFPSQSGYQVFLIDAPPERTAEISRNLTRALEDVGLTLTPAYERMAAFDAVENTYLSIFAVLGGLGLLLGSVGLGIVVMRNVLERRSELALLRAVGFRSRALQWLVFSEHTLLLLLGLMVGVAAALVAVLPALRTPGAEVPVSSLALTLLAVLVSGFVWTGLSTLLALRGPVLKALRNE